ncbi:MAG: hypothetical protein ACTSRK_06100 [Promethearchaeota archaeon]
MEKPDNNQPKDIKPNNISTPLKAPIFTFDNIKEKYFKFSRNLQTPGDFVDYVIDIVIPKLAKNQQDIFLGETQDSIDFIFRHLL